MNINFDMLRAPGWTDQLSKAMSEIGDSIQAERARKQKMELEAERIAGDQNIRQQDADTRDAREMRQQRSDDAQLEVDNAKRQRQADDTIRADVASGNMVAAKQHAADYSEVDPSTRTVKRGRDFEQLPDLNPGAPPELKPETSEADTAANLGAQDSAIANAGKPPVTGRVRIGGVETSTDELRHSADRQAAADFDKVGESLTGELGQAMQSGDPYLRSIAQRRAERFSQLQAGVKSGTIAPRDAMKEFLSSEALADKYGENRAHDQTVGQFGIEKQRVANSKPSADKQRTAGTDGIDRKDLQTAESGLKDFQKNWNIATDRNEDTRLRGLLKNKDVSVVQRSLSDVLSRSLAGQKGVLTDADINRLQGHMGGAWGDVTNWVSKGATGDLDPDVFAKLMQGVDVVLQNHETNRQGARKAYDEVFGDGSSYSKLKIGDHLTRKRKEFFVDDAEGAGGAPGGETREQRIARIRERLGR